MRLLRAKFRNWCQHSSLDVSFADSLNAVRGPNGSGKSNLLTGIVFGITGDFSRNSGVKIDNIYQLAGEKDRAGVTLELVHGNTRLTIERNLRPNNQKLIIEGAKEPFTKADDINDKIREVLGVNERMLLDYVFVDQWKIFSFIDQSPTVRAKVFGELFDAARAEHIWRKMGDFKPIIPMPSIDGDKVRLRMAETETEIKQLRVELARLDSLPEQWHYDTDPLHDVIKGYLHKESLISLIDSLNSQLTSNNNNLLWASNERDRLQIQLNLQRDNLNRMRDEFEQSKNDLARWSTYDAVSKMKATLENEIHQLKEEQASLPLLPKPDNYCGPVYNSHDDKLTQMRVELAAEERILSTFDPTRNLASCPQCDTPVAQLQARIDQAQQRSTRLRGEIKDLTDSITSSKAHDAAIAQRTTTIGRIKNQLHTAEVRLSTVSIVNQPSKSQDELKLVVDTYATIEAAYNDTAAHVVKNKELVDKYEWCRASIEPQRDKATTELATIAITKEEAAAAKTELTNRLSQYNLRSNLRFAIDTKLRMLKDDEAALKKCRIDEFKADKVRRTVNHLSDVRGVFKDLPLVAAQACLDSLTEDINEVLEKFDAPFRVLNVDGLRFTLKKYSGIITSAERLSGGEKAVFALAFRIAVNSKFAGSLGLLCLDEPTAGLDEDNVSCLEVALERLRELSTSRGLQVILITHETGLDGLFDKVIKLSAVH